MNNNQKVPPSSPEVERSVLGSLLVIPTLIPQVAEKLPSEAFSATQNREIYKGITAMYDDSGIPDILTLAEYLQEKDKLDSVGGEIYLSALTEMVDTRPNINPWIDILIKKHRARIAIHDLTTIVTQAFQPEIEIDTILSNIERTKDRILDVGTENECTKFKKGRIVRIKEIESELLEYHETGIEKVGTEFDWWPIFSEHFRFVKGTLNVINGIPSHGKSTFVDQMIIDTVLSHGYKHAIFCPEGNKRYHLKSLVEKSTGRPLFGNQGLAKSEIERAIETLNDYIYIIEPVRTNSTLKAVLKLMQEAVDKYNVDVITIDPWNKIYHEYEGRETLYIRDSLRRIQNMAINNNTCNNIVAHPTKMYKRPGQTEYTVPTLYEVDGSAHWFNCTDNGVTFYRNFKKNYAEAHIQKIKEKPYGKIGVCYFRYNDYNGKLYEITYDQAKGEDFELPFEKEVIKEPEPVQQECWQDKY